MFRLLTIEQGHGYEVNIRAGILVFAPNVGERGFYKIILNFANFSPKIFEKIMKILTVPKNVSDSLNIYEIKKKRM